MEFFFCAGPADGDRLEDEAPCGFTSTDCIHPYGVGFLLHGLGIRYCLFRASVFTGAHATDSRAAHAADDGGTAPSRRVVAARPAPSERTDQEKTHASNCHSRPR